MKNSDDSDYIPELDDYELPPHVELDYGKAKPNRFADLDHILPPYAKIESKSELKPKSATKTGRYSTKRVRSKPKRVAVSASRKATKSKSR